MKNNYRDWLNRADIKEKFYNGDFFKFWSGPMPPENDPSYTQTREKIERVFHSANIIKELIDRECTALIGQSPHWYLKGTNGDRLPEGSLAEIDLQVVLDWIEELAASQESVHGDPITKAVTDMLVTGIGYLALYEPKRYINSSDFEKHIGLYSPDRAAIRYKRDSDGVIEWVERYYGNNRKEVQYLDETQLLHIDVYEDESLLEDESFVTDTGGKYTVYELSSDSMISESLMQCQNSINKTLTMKSLNNELGGFLERVVTSGLPPGRIEDDPSAPGGYKYVPTDAPIEVGAGRTTFIQPIPIYGDGGQITSYTNPNVNYREPVNSEAFASSLEIDFTLAYREARQSHLLSVGDGRLAGVSRESIKADHIAALEKRSRVIEVALRSIYSVILWRLAALRGKDEYRLLQPVVQLRLSVGKSLPEERDAMLSFQQAGLISKATAITLSGFTDDSDAEIALLKEEEQERNATQTASDLVVSGIIDQPSAEELLRARGVLPKDSNGSDRTKDVLNGQR